MHASSPTRTVALFLLFLFLIAVFMAVRDGGVRGSLTNPNHQLEEFSQIASGCNSFPFCLRIGSSLLGEGIQSLTVGVVNAFISVDPASFGGEGQLTADTRMAKLLGSVLFRIIVLLPIFLVAMLLFERAWAKAGFLVLTFLALTGWGPWLYAPWYNFVRKFVDWPVAWWDFFTGVPYFGFASIGFVFLLLAYLAARRPVRLWEMAALAALGQSIVENLGLVTGVAVFLFTLLTDRRAGWWRSVALASRRIAACGLASLLVLVLSMVLVNPQFTDARSPGMVEQGGFALAVRFLQEHWEAYGRLNLQAIDIVTANVFTLLWPPLLFGGLFGLVLAMVQEMSDEEVRIRAAAGISAAGGFAASLGVGLFMSGIQSDMGRQILPLIGVCFFAGIYIAAWTARRWHRA